MDPNRKLKVDLDSRKFYVETFQRVYKDDVELYKTLTTKDVKVDYAGMYIFAFFFHFSKLSFFHIVICASGPEGNWEKEGPAVKLGPVPYKITPCASKDVLSTKKYKTYLGHPDRSSEDCDYKKVKLVS